MSALLLILSLTSGTPCIVAAYAQPDMPTCEYVRDHSAVIESWREIAGDVVIVCSGVQ